MKKNKRQSNKNLLLGVFGLTIICGISQAIISPKELKMAQIENQGINTQLSNLNATTSVVVDLATSTEVVSNTLSNGDRVIKTKTQYFDNEVQVYLAAEQASKYVGQGDKMITDLVAMAYTESRNFNCKAISDGGKSRGCWQIHLGYHPNVKVEQAEDPYWAAIWTAKRLIAKGWEKDREYAIRSHNGNPVEKQTLPYIKTVNSYISM